MESRFPLARRPAFHGLTVGRDAEPVLSTDRLLARPDALVEAAAASAFAPAHGPAGGYPGLRAPAPLDYVADVVRTVTPLIGEAFGLGPVRAVRADCTFSLVTLPPDRLVPAQRAPHVDTVDPWQFALLHYLCDARFGGTAFFRHRATGFEAVTAERLAAYEAARAGEDAEAGYVADGGRWFERVGAVGAAFDRLVVYRSRLLHSGAIEAPELLSPDPRRGRLTVNIFLTLRPA